MTKTDEISQGSFLRSRDVFYVNHKNRSKGFLAGCCAVWRQGHQVHQGDSEAGYGVMVGIWRTLALGFVMVLNIEVSGPLQYILYTITDYIILHYITV